MLLSHRKSETSYVEDHFCVSHTVSGKIIQTVQGSATFACQSVHALK